MGNNSTIDLRPEICNLCGGTVIYTTNARVYGKEYGSGKCYLCTECRAYVGTHEPRPREALGLLADAEMRMLKMNCHEIFDPWWKTLSTSRKRYKARNKLYIKLADELQVPIEQCHFGHFDKEMLLKALAIIKSWEDSGVTQ